MDLANTTTNMNYMKGNKYGILDLQENNRKRRSLSDILCERPKKLKTTPLYKNVPRPILPHPIISIDEGDDDLVVLKDTRKKLQLHPTISNGKSSDKNTLHDNSSTLVQIIKSNTVLTDEGMQLDEQEIGLAISESAQSDINSNKSNHVNTTVVNQTPRTMFSQMKPKSNKQNLPSNHKTFDGFAESDKKKNKKLYIMEKTFANTVSNVVTSSVPFQPVINNVFTTNTEDFESNSPTLTNEKSDFISSSDIYIGKGYPFEKYAHKCKICEVSFNEHRDLIVHHKSPIHYRKSMTEKSKVIKKCNSSSETSQKHQPIINNVFRPNLEQKKTKKKHVMHCKLGNKNNSLDDFNYVPLNFLKQKIVMYGNVKVQCRQCKKRQKKGLDKDDVIYTFEMGENEKDLPLVFIPYQIKLKTIAGQEKVVTMYLPHADDESASSIVSSLQPQPDNSYIGEAATPLYENCKVSFNHLRSSPFDEGTINATNHIVPQNNITFDNQTKLIASNHTHDPLQVPVVTQADTDSIVKDQSTPKKLPNSSNSKVNEGKENTAVESFMQKLGLTTVSSPRSSPTLNVTQDDIDTNTINEQRRTNSSRKEKQENLANKITPNKQTSPRLSVSLNNASSDEVSLSNGNNAKVETPSKTQNSPGVLPQKLKQTVSEISPKKQGSPEVPLNKQSSPEVSSNIKTNASFNIVSQGYLSVEESTSLSNYIDNLISKNVKVTGSADSSTFGKIQSIPVPFMTKIPKESLGVKQALINEEDKQKETTSQSVLVCNPSPGIANSIKIKPSEFRLLKVPLLKLKNIGIPKEEKIDTDIDFSLVTPSKQVNATPLSADKFCVTPTHSISPPTTRSSKRSQQNTRLLTPDQSGGASGKKNSSVVKKNKLLTPDRSNERNSRSTSSSTKKISLRNRNIVMKDYNKSYGSENEDVNDPFKNFVDAVENFGESLPNKFSIISTANSETKVQKIYIGTPKHLNKINGSSPSSIASPSKCAENVAESSPKLSPTPSTLLSPTKESMLSISKISSCSKTLSPSKTMSSPVRENISDNLPMQTSINDDNVSEMDIDKSPISSLNYDHELESNSSPQNVSDVKEKLISSDVEKLSNVEEDYNNSPDKLISSDVEEDYNNSPDKLISSDVEEDYNNSPDKLISSDVEELNNVEEDYNNSPDNLISSDVEELSNVEEDYNKNPDILSIESSEDENGEILSDLEDEDSVQEEFESYRYISNSEDEACITDDDLNFSIDEAVVNTEIKEEITDFEGKFEGLAETRSKIKNYLSLLHTRSPIQIDDKEEPDEEIKLSEKSPCKLAIVAPDSRDIKKLDYGGAILKVKTKYIGQSIIKCKSIQKESQPIQASSSSKDVEKTVVPVLSPLIEDDVNIKKDIFSGNISSYRNSKKSFQSKSKEPND